MTRTMALAVLVLLVGCAQPMPVPSGQGAVPPVAQPAPSAPTTLQAVVKVEPASLAAKPLTPTGISIALAQRLFNATLDLDDGQENTHPYLAEALPQLNTDSWRVFPDGRMETTWH